MPAGQAEEVDPGVNQPLTPERPKRVREAPEMRGAVERFMRSLVRRCVEDGDLDAFAALVDLEDALRAYTLDAVTGLKADPHGYSWAEIGEAIPRPVSRQGAQQRWRKAGAGGRKPGGQPADRR
jgi:hypothetical protein